jgi:FkbM family methyltransferase
MAHGEELMAITHAEHAVFRRFDRYAGGAVPGFNLNFIGQRSNPTFDGQDLSKASSADYPQVSDESFEWIAVLEAVLEAQKTFTMFELGAGYGRWLVAAVCAARQQRPDLSFKLVGVEPEPTHFRFLHQHFLDNGLDPKDHQLIEAAVNATGETVHFIVGHPEEWYGQAIVPEGFIMQAYPTARTTQVSAVKLVDLLESHSYVDLIDMDIQGAELGVVLSSIDAMTAKARRAYISTHSPDIHSKLAHTFTAAGWTLVEIYGWTGDKEETQFGPITFSDGIQYWLNPHVLRTRSNQLKSES